MLVSSRRVSQASLASEAIRATRGDTCKYSHYQLLGLTISVSISVSQCTHLARDPPRS
ncbi:hypothetical protein J6590_105569, partial [Homalodisca vitripennis]